MLSTHSNNRHDNSNNVFGNFDSNNIYSNQHKEEQEPNYDDVFEDTLIDYNPKDSVVEVLAIMFSPKKKGQLLESKNKVYSNVLNKEKRAI